ncbi:MAG: hypothetical protein IJX18_01285 [Clostridia bacterium]|nr:hypothetical protein [Clostridia bacterium]
MIYAKKTSRNKIVHIETCHHVKGKKRHYYFFPNLQTAYSQGYRLCKTCDPLLKTWKREKHSALNYAQKLGIKLQYDGCHLKATCGNEYWKIVVKPRGNGIALYHKNLTTYYEDPYVPYYHRQNLDCRTLLQILQYIHDHYKYRKKNPVILSTNMKNIKKQKPRKQGKEKQQNNQKLVSLLKSLHKEDVYKDFLCYLT